MKPSEMDDQELEAALRRAAKDLDSWKERGRPKNVEELDEHLGHYMLHKQLAAETTRRKQEREAGRKSPWN